MEPRKRQIDEVQAEIGRLEQQISAECVAIGRHIAGLNHRDSRSPELAKYLHSVNTLRRNEEDFRNDITGIRDTVRKLQDLSAAVADNDRRSREIERERESRYVELGAGAYSVYKGLRDRDRWRPFFEQILKLDADIERMQADLKTLEGEEKKQGLFEKLKSKGRKIVVRGSITKVEKQKMGAYKDAGAKLADSEFASLAAGDLRLLFDFAAEKKRAIDGLQGDAQRLGEEMARHRGTLKRYGADGDDADARCSELEKRIADVRRELQVLYGWIGQLFLDKDLRSDIADTQLSAKYEIVNGMRQTIARKRSQIHRLMAELEIEDLQKREKELRLKRKQLEEELKVKDRQIATKDLEIAAGQKRMEELRRVMAGEAPYTEAPPFPPTPDFYTRKPPAP